MARRAPRWRREKARMSTESRSERFQSEPRHVCTISFPGTSDRNLPVMGRHLHATTDPGLDLRRAPTATRVRVLARREIEAVQALGRRPKGDRLLDRSRHRALSLELLLH